MPIETYPKSVETQTPETIDEVSVRQRALLEGLEFLPIDVLRSIPLPDMDEKNEKDKPKNKLLQDLSSFYAFSSEEQLDVWLSWFPPLSQKILRDISQFYCVIIDKYKKEADKPLVIKENSVYSWNTRLEHWLNLDFLWVSKTLDIVSIGMPAVLREALRPWFVPAPEASLEGCVIEDNAGVVFSNALEVSGSLPLLCEALPAALSETVKEGDKEPSRERGFNLRPFNKKQLDALRGRCGFKQFPAVYGNGYYEKTPDSLDLASRFILCMTGLKPERPEDGQDGLKKLIEEFFAIDKSKKDLNDPVSPKWNYFEMNVLTAHLKKRTLPPGHYRGPPPSRQVFLKILTMIAGDGRWFSTASLARYILINEYLFNFVHPQSENRLYIKAGSLALDGVVYKCAKGETDLFPLASLRFDLLLRPLFNAYCYLLAALGLLELTQKNPPEPVTNALKKTRPISPYDALDAVRVTNLGRWCLGLTEERPGRLQEQYEAIADHELLLVTVRGFSFERTLYLDTIGEKLGEDRWRISPRSFISGCTGKPEIEDRIKKFRRLIDKEPAPHWEALFRNALERAGFQARIVPATAYFLGGSRSLAEDLLNDPLLSSCAMRAEGGMLLVPDRLKKKFLDLLSDHGVLY
ncbi:hypothetical protein FACS1894147_06120 [Spirochaetia bacterium]|nr:hypothetical protein FACS1894147_06120 [Spirochaetia bacterium]